MSELINQMSHEILKKLICEILLKKILWYCYTICKESFFSYFDGHSRELLKFEPKSLYSTSANATLGFINSTFIIFCEKYYVTKKDSYCLYDF